MPTEIDRQELRRLLEDDAQLVEVMPLEEYEQEHLAGARSIPLRELPARALLELDRRRPVIVYCYDSA